MPSGTAGSCGGSLDVAWVHDNGDTRYDLLFSDYCLSSDSTDAVLVGRASGMEDGIPSDDGPVVDSFSLDSDGPLTVTHDEGALELELSGFVDRYGAPAAWQPETPTAASPDIITVDRFSARVVDSDEPALSIVDLRIERVGAVPELTVTEGAVVLDGEGHVQISTPDGEPLVLDLLLPESGSIVFEGADGAELVARSVPGQTLVYTLELDGQPIDLGLDCSDSLPLLLELAPTLLASLPLY